MHGANVRFFENVFGWLFADFIQISNPSASKFIETGNKSCKFDSQPLPDLFFHRELTATFREIFEAL